MLDGLGQQCVMALDRENTWMNTFSNSQRRTIRSDLTIPKEDENLTKALALSLEPMKADEEQQLSVVL